MTTQLPAVKLKPKHYEDIEKQLMKIFFEIVFKPLAELVSKATQQAAPLGNVMRNAAGDALRAALSERRVQYLEGQFFGEFSARISIDLRAIGAKLDKRSGVYKMRAKDVPAWIKAVSTEANDAAVKLHQELERTLNHIESSLDQAVEKYKVDPDHAVDQIQKDFRSVAERLSVDPELSQSSKAALKEDYTDNMKLNIQTFSDKMVQDLRGVVQENAEQGCRFDRLIQGIQGKYDVSQSKAKFLARQETSLFMSKFTQKRYEEAGVQKYRWSTSHDARVRDDHDHLDKKVFFFSEPPITDRSTGARNNPGCDFNCRCVAIPILEEAA